MLQLSNHEEAIELLSHAIQLNSRNPSYFFERGLAWTNAGKCDQAIPDYNKAIELSPRMSVAYNNRAVCHIRAGHRDEAEADLETALKYDPGNQQARKNLEIQRNSPVPKPEVVTVAPVPTFEPPPIKEMLQTPEFPPD